MPEASIGGCDHVVAIVPEGSDVSRVAEDPGAVLLRLESEEEVGPCAAGCR